MPKCTFSHDMVLVIATDKRGHQLNIFLILHKNIYYGYSLEVPQTESLLMNNSHKFLWRNKKKYQYFWGEKSALSGAMSTIFVLKYKITFL